MMSGIKQSSTNPTEQRDALPNQDNFLRVTRDDLPLHCPLPGSALWSSHPKVYIPIEATGEAKCSYCGAEYELVTRVSERPDE